MQKTPAKLCSLRALPSAWAPAWLVRSQRPVRGHHFCFSTSRSPVSCSSRILQDRMHAHEPQVLTFCPQRPHHTGCIISRSGPCLSRPSAPHCVCTFQNTGLALSLSSSKASRPSPLPTLPHPTSQGRGPRESTPGLRWALGVRRGSWQCRGVSRTLRCGLRGHAYNTTSFELQSLYPKSLPVGLAKSLTHIVPSMMCSMLSV